MSEGFRRLIRHLRRKDELEKLCKRKGLNMSLAHRVAIYMSLGLESIDISQICGIHNSTTKRYMKILGSLEESQFESITNLPRIMTAFDREVNT